MNDIITRDESKLHKVPTKVISTMPIVIFVMLISIIISIVLFIRQNISMACIWLGVGILCRVWGKFVDIYFNFKQNYSIEFQKEQVLVTYDLDNQILSSKDCKAKIIIKEITKLVRKKNSLVVYGIIIEKKPHQNKKELQKYVIDLKGFANCDTIIGKFNEYIKV